jgi:alpha-N-acetylglucosamine transferase
MVEKHIDRPFRFVCLTDRKKLVPYDIESWVVPTPGLFKAWWTKLKLFDPSMPLDQRVLYLDLDVLIVGSLNEIIDYPAEFAIAPDSAPTFDGKGNQKTIKAYNSSVMVWDHGKRSDLWEKWKPGATAHLWSDQDWIAKLRPNEATFPKEWFRRVSAGPPPWPDETKVVMCIKPKNHLAVKKWPWFEDLWK